MNSMNSRQVFEVGNVPAVILILLCALGLHWPHLISFIGDQERDFYLHYNWAKEFSDNFFLGDAYPRWIFPGRYGLGEPVFLTYSPMYYYLVVFFRWLGLNTWNSMQVIAIVTNALFGLFVYGAALRLLSRNLALFVALTALVSPFLVMLHYKFGGLPWGSVGYATQGMLLWALVRQKDKGLVLNTWAALAIGLSVGAHILSALINLICFSFFCLARATPWAGQDRQKLGRVMVSWGVTALVGLALSAVYLLPALNSTGVMTTSSWDGEFRVNSFVFPTFTLIYGEPYWISLQWPVPLLALFMLLAAGSYYFKFRGTLSRLEAPLLAVLAGAAVSVFFASELSYPVWTFQNPISQINLAFRFISISFTLGALAGGIALAHALGERRRAWAIILAGTMALSMVAGVGALLKGTYGDGRPLIAEMRQGKFTYLDSEKRFHEPGYLEGCKQNKKACIELDKGVGVFKGVPEYRLIWAKDAYFEFAQKGYSAYCAELGIHCDAPQRKSSGLDLRIVTDKPVAARLPLFYYPAWQVTLAGAVLVTEPDPDTGVLRVNLPAGQHDIAIRWKPSKVENIGKWTSLLALLFLLIHGVFACRRCRCAPTSD